MQPSAVVAGSAMAPAVQVTVQDAQGNAVTSSTASITLAIDSGTGTTGALLGGTLTQAAVNGVATFGTLTVDKAGTGCTLTATAASLTSATSAVFNVTPGAVSTSQSSVSVSAATALSGSTVTLQLQAKDANGNNLTTGGLTVVFSASGGTSTGTISATTDNGNGTYTATFTAVTAGTATSVRATIGGTAVTSTLPTVTVTAGAVSLSQSTVLVSAGTVASGGAVALQLQAKDANGNNLITGGLAVVFLAGGGTSTGTIGATTDNGNGTYRADFIAGTAGTAKTISATINGTAVTSPLPTVTVTPGAASTSLSTVAVSAATAVSGSTVTLTLQAKDANGNNLTTGGLVVVFLAGGGTSTGTISATTDNANGTYRADFIAGTVGTAKTIGATINGTAVTSPLPTVTVTPGAASTSLSTVAVSAATAVSGSTVTLTLQAKDGAGNNLTIGGLAVVFLASGGTSTGTISATTDNANGTYTATFTAVTAGTATSVRATIGGTAVTSPLPTVTVTPGAASTSQSTVSVSAGTAVSGSTVSLTLQARDANGNDLTSGGLTVVFTASGGTSTGTIGATTDNANGTYTATFTAVTAGTATTVGATIEGAAVTSTLPTITVTAGAVSTSQSAVSVSAATAVSGSTVTLTLQARDGAGNNLTSGGLTVVFSASGGTSTGTIGATTDNANGTYTATFTAVTAGTATSVRATIGGTAVTSPLPTVTVTPGAASTSQSTVSVSAGTVASGSAVALQLQAKDANGNNLTSGGLTVVFTASGGTSTGTIGATTDNGNGTYTATFTAVTAGTPRTVSATINGTAVTSTLPTVTVTPLGIGLALDQFSQIPAGTFQMGSTAYYTSEQPVHSVTISSTFYMQKTEVTQGQWRAVMGSNPSSFSTCGDTCPVEQVSWDDITTFLQLLNAQTPGVTYRLPTEAEWEYAARAGTTGETYGTLDAIAWYSGNSASMTHAAAGKQANAWGLYDMIGNVFEWVNDYVGSYSSASVTDPTGPATGTYRVLRGGSWLWHSLIARAAYRDAYLPSARDGNFGFRLVRTP